MKSKTFVMLLVAAGILVTLSVLRFGPERQNGKKSMGMKLFAELPVNEVAKVTLTDSENRVTLVKGETVWQVDERSGYPADFNELRDMVVKLSKLKIGRSFTASPESITRLSLASPETADAPGKGKQISLSDASGNLLADVIIGEARKTETGASGGQYLKKAETEDIFLVDGSFPFLKTSPAQWLKKEVLNLKADEIETVTCYSVGNKTPVYSLSRPKKGDTAQLDPVPEGRVANSSKIDQVFDALAPLTLDDVQRGDPIEQAEKQDQTRLVYRLYDGREIAVFPDTDNQEPYTLRITARQIEPTVTETSSDESGETPKVNEEDAEDKSVDPSGQKPPQKRSAEQMNAEVSPWVFTVKKWQFDSLITQPELLLEEVKKDGETS